MRRAGPRSIVLTAIAVDLLAAYYGDMALAEQDGLDRGRARNREDDDRHMVLPGKREGSRVHDLEVAFDRFVVGEPIVAFGARVLLRIGAVDTIDISCLEHGVAAHFGRAKDGGG